MRLPSMLCKTRNSFLAIKKKYYLVTTQQHIKKGALSAQFTDRPPAYPILILSYPSLSHPYPILIPISAVTYSHHDNCSLGCPCFPAQSATTILLPKRNKNSKRVRIKKNTRALFLFFIVLSQKCAAFKGNFLLLVTTYHNLLSSSFSATPLWSGQL